MSKTGSGSVVAGRLSTAKRARIRTSHDGIRILDISTLGRSVNPGQYILRCSMPVKHEMPRECRELRRGCGPAIQFRLASALGDRDFIISFFDDSGQGRFGSPGRSV
jgi:hypothetical protein